MQPKSEEIADQLIAAITRGKYTSNMPSEQELARLYKTTAVTASKALNILRDRNIVRRIPRLGTFINNDFRRPIRIWLTIPDLIAGEIKDLLKNKFPQFEFEIIHDSNLNPLDSDFDIIRTAATFPYSFSKYLRPLPDKIVEEYRDSGNFFSDLINISCDHRIYYTLPVLFSPQVLCFNKDLARKLKIEFPRYNFSVEDFIALGEVVKNSSLNLCAEDAFVWIRYVLFRDITTESALPLGELERELRKRQPQVMKVLENLEHTQNNSFEEGRSLFKVLCRQQLYNRCRQFEFDWDILPMPKLTGARTAATGEFLAVMNSSQNQENAFKVARAFLDEDIQRVIARHKFGLPVRKSLIPDTLDSLMYRDDIFINEIGRMSTDNAVNHELHTACLPQTQDFYKQKISTSDFCQQVINIFMEIAESAKRRKKAEQNYNFADM